MIEKCSWIFPTKQSKRYYEDTFLFDPEEIEEVNWERLLDTPIPYYYIICFAEKCGKLIKLIEKLDGKVDNELGSFFFEDGRFIAECKGHAFVGKEFKAYYSDWKLHSSPDKTTKVNKYGVMSWYNNGLLCNGKFGYAVYNKYNDTEKYVDGILDKDAGCNFYSRGRKINIIDDIITCSYSRGKTIVINGKILDNLPDETYYYFHIGYFTIKNGLINEVTKVFNPHPQEVEKYKENRMGRTVIRLR